MTTSQVITSFFDYLQTKLVGDVVFDARVFDPDLNFDPRGRQVVIGEDVKLKLRSGKQNWLLMMWTREVLGSWEEQGRSFLLGKREVGELDAGQYDYRMGKLSLKMGLVSPSMLRLEEVEEALHVRRVDGPFDFTVEGLGSYKGSVNGFSMSGLVKFPTEQFGSISSLLIDANLVYPVLVARGSAKLVGRVALDVYTYI